MRQTKMAETDRKTGNLRAVQLLLGRAKVNSAVRYLVAELKDALSTAKSFAIPKRSRSFDTGNGSAEPKATNALPASNIHFNAAKSVCECLSLLKQSDCYLR